MKKEIIADGVSLVDQKAFQSYVCQIECFRSDEEWHRGIKIPSQILRHLRLERGDMVEIALRKVTPEYTMETYGYDSSDFKLLCPICGQFGYLQKFGASYRIDHEKKVRFAIGRNRWGCKIESVSQRYHLITAEQARLMQSRPDDRVKCSKDHDNTKTAKFCWRCGERLQ